MYVLFFVEISYILNNKGNYHPVFLYFLLKIDTI